ncbi:hypothetical protein AXG89_41655 (plasmid) [Burkholderia sp. PAMC 26561]|nr:hypothetical protein AXG89_41655 [Burkholderia sp. PAMC 26561]
MRFVRRDTETLGYCVDGKTPPKLPRIHRSARRQVFFCLIFIVTHSPPGFRKKEVAPNGVINKLSKNAVLGMGFAGPTF